jgi:hypothetical protein
MRNVDFNSSVERMKQLMNHGDQDAKLKANVSETVEYKVGGPDGKTYGVVRERQKYFIKESKDGVNFEYVGGIGNKSENEYPSYNSAYRNLELKIRSLNESVNNGKVFEVLPTNTTSEYIIEATEDMRRELDRFKQITNGAQNIMNESSTEFINKPKFKDPESFGTATDPKKQGQPFTDAATAKLDKDPNFKATDPKKQGSPFTGKAKSKEDKFDIEKTNETPANAGDPFNVDAKDVLGNSVATQKPKGGKVIKITESQLAQIRKRLSEGLYDDEEEYSDDTIADDSFGAGFPSKAGGVPAGEYSGDMVDDGDDFEETYDTPEFDDEGMDDMDDMGSEDVFPIPSRVKYVGDDPELGRMLGKFTSFDYLGQAPGSNNSYVMGTKDVNGRTKEVEYIVPTSDLVRVGLNENFDEEEMVDEGLWDTIKGIGSVGKHFGNKGAGAVKQGAQNVAGKVGSAYGTAKQKVGDAYGTAKQGVQNVGREASQVWNQSQAQSSQASIDKIANNLKNELVNLNSRTVKSGGQPLNYNSVLTSLSNKLRGQLKNTVATESVDGDMDENLVNEITEAVLNAFGQHPTYQKAAFTTPSDKGTPYGQKIGDSAPFTKPVKQKVGEGEIGEDADETMKGKTPQAKPNLGQKGDKAPFDKGVQKNGDKIAKGTPVQQGEKPQGKPELGKKGDKAPFDKQVKKSDVLNKLAESIISDLKKK